VAVGAFQDVDLEDSLHLSPAASIFSDGRRHTLSLLLRNNLKSPNRNSVQVDWSFPGFDRMSGYVQFFTGYGESMIDYNHRQTTIGLGLILTNVM
jgi:phospholipase A1